MTTDPTTTDPAAEHSDGDGCDPRSYDHVTACRARESASGQRAQWRTRDGAPFDPRAAEAPRGHVPATDCPAWCRAPAEAPLCPSCQHPWTDHGPFGCRGEGGAAGGPACTSYCAAEAPAVQPTTERPAEDSPAALDETGTGPQATDQTLGEVLGVDPTGPRAQRLREEFRAIEDAERRVYVRPAPAPSLGTVLGEEAREHYGRMVRDVWMEWAREQPNPKPSWLTPWDELTEPEREVDRRIGASLVRDAEQRLRTRIAEMKAQAEEDDRRGEQRDREVQQQRDRDRATIDRWRQRAEAAEAKVRAVELVHVWTNEDRKGFLFADDVREALGLSR